MKKSSTRDLVIALVRSFHSYCGKDEFTYEELRKFYYSKFLKFSRFRKLEWHSVERMLRRLASEGLLARYHPHPKKVVFIIPPLLVRQNVGSSGS